MYKSSSVLLAPSRGEGFGLTPLEAMSVGIPVIYSDWSGFTDTAPAPGNTPIKCDIDLSINMNHHGYDPNSFYAYPRISDLVLSLKNKYKLWLENREQYYKEVSDNYKIVNEKFGMDACKKYLLDIINN